ncbi:MAG: CRISPR-associated helicase Cas3' [bacterium]|nr:CRISPR-associated helicase Cas3' [bacterium]
MSCIEELLNKNYVFYAHPGETISEHTDKVYKYWLHIIKERNLQPVLDRLKKFWNIIEQQSKLYNQVNDFIWSVMVSTITLHDIGKINPLFQKDKMHNPLFRKVSISYSLNSTHSIISAILYMDYYLGKLEELTREYELEGKQVRHLVFLIFINGYIISKHHGNLGEFEAFVNEFDAYEGIYNNTIDEIRTYIIQYTDENTPLLKGNRIGKHQKKLKRAYSKATEDNITVFTYERFMFSLLLACDYYATSEQNSQVSITEFGVIGDIRPFVKIYEDTELMHSIRKYQKQSYNMGNNTQNKISGINELRCELFLDAEHNFQQLKQENQIYFQAPTGMGKTNVAINLSFQIIKNSTEINKILYIYPFNTLVEQNEEIFNQIFGNHNELIKQIHIVNSLHSLLDNSKKQLSEQSYQNILLDRQFLNYPITLSTHVTLFDIMFGNRRESAFSFHQLANSVIVLDEIQSYRNTIWSEIITFLNGFADLLNIKVIIMSATLPKLSHLALYTKAPMVLLPNVQKYYSHPLYLHRSNIHYELLASENPKEALFEKVLEFTGKGKKLLIEFITKKSATDFYQKLKECNVGEYKLELITGDDNAIERKRILNRLCNASEEEPFILVATQVIEAGVDLNNIDVGFKDCSILDSEEQFMGRINRSCNMSKIGEVYFFNLDTARLIYRDDVRVDQELTLQNKEMRNVLEHKEYDSYYAQVMERLHMLNLTCDTRENLEDFFEKQVGRLNSLIVSERMKLICDNEWQVSVFFNQKIQVGNEQLVGKEIWKQYKELLKDQKLSYARKQVLLSDIKSKMNYFIYNVKSNVMFQYDDSDGEQIGEMYYVDSGENYFEDGKFNRQKFETTFGMFI